MIADTILVFFFFFVCVLSFHTVNQIREIYDWLETDRNVLVGAGSIEREASCAATYGAPR